jgi:hypothetical protein
MRRLKMAAAFIACGLIVADCATEGTSGGSVDLYGGFYYDDGWYGGGGCCVNYPDDIGPPPHPEHPIAKPPVQPVATDRQAARALATHCLAPHALAAPLDGGWWRRPAR